MNETVLFVDDNRLHLTALRDLLQNEPYTVLTATDATSAIELFRTHEIAVIVSDNYMPGMNGLDLLISLKEISPDTVKILMTAYGDLASALIAINRSEVFRYILKPWQDADVITAVEEGLQRYRLHQTLLQEDENVLRSLAQAIELKDPSTRGHCDRVAIYALMIAKALGIPKETQRQIKYGGWLHDCGKIGVSELILNGQRGLTEDEVATMRMHSSWGAEVATKANLSKVARNVIRYHHERYDGTGYPNGLAGVEIPLEARIVAIADVFDALTSDRPYRARCTPAAAITTITDMKGSAFDPAIVDLFVQILAEKGLPQWTGPEWPTDEASYLPPSP